MPQKSHSFVCAAWVHHGSFRAYKSRLQSLEVNVVVESSLTQLIERNGQAVARRMATVRVTVLDGPDKGAVFEGAQEEIRLGGADDNDLVIRDPSVSRRHVSLGLEAGGIRVRDLGSTNGTFMGELRVHDVVITGIRELSLGTTKIRVEPTDAAVEKDLSMGIRFGRLVGTSAAMREVFAVLERIAPSDLPVLVEGEAGTGKELVADAIHRRSPRAGGPFVVVDCGVVPRDRIEAELFGHAKSGTQAETAGSIRSADGGTLVLEEVGELSLEAQARLLRVLETRETRPVGATNGAAVDVRIVATSARNLLREIKDGRFRQDLYYRLSSVVVKLPPLRSRLQDVPLLVDTVLEDLGRRRAAQGLAGYGPLDPRAMDLLERYDFPGNVRELRNLVERFAVLGPDATVIPQTGGAPKVGGHEIRTDLPFHDAKEIWTEIFEKTYLTDLLKTHHGNVSAAARASGIDRRHLQRLMVKHDLRERDRADEV